MGKQWKQPLRELFQKEKGIKLVVLLGICGIALIGLSSFWEPGGEKPSVESDPVSQEYSRRLEEDLSRVVTAITGEESPTVVVTLQDNGRTQFATDQQESSQQEEGRSSQERETTHILLDDGDGGQTALEESSSLPEVRGVVVVSRAAADPAVREKLLNALCTALDVSSAKVYVTGSG